jgi:hypothetical protein
MNDEKRVDLLVPGDVFVRAGTSVLVLEKPVPSVETVAPLAGLPCIRVRGRRLDTLQEGDMNFGLNAVVRLVATSADNAIPRSALCQRHPQRGSSRPSEWPLK